MTDFNFPHPLRLAAGSHQPGSGKGCAMNVISYENGDTRITDYPECSARPLARIVQRLNDRLADERTGFLSPEDSITVLEIGHLTVGTAGHDRRTLNLWLRDLLVDPVHGVVQYASDDGAAAVRRVADLLTREGDVPRAEWVNARNASAAYAHAVAASAAYAHAVAASAASAASAARAAQFAAHAVAASAAYADAAASAAYADAVAHAAEFAAAGRSVEWTRWAVQRFRDLMGIDAPEVDQETTEAAVRRMLTVGA